MFVNIGYGNVVNTDKVISIVSSVAAPVKRMVQSAKDAGTAVDATCGKKTKSVLVMENGYVVLCALVPETITARFNNTDMQDQKIKEDEAADE